MKHSPSVTPSNSVARLAKCLVAPLLVAFGLVSAGAGTGCTIIAHESAEQCSSQADCLRFGSGFTCGEAKTCVPVAGFCQTNRECTALAPDQFCKKNAADPTQNRCAPLFTNECRAQNFLGTKEELEADPLILGMIWQGSWGSDLLAGVNGLALARNDFQQSGGVTIGGEKRGVVFVGCDIPENNYEAVVPAATHLAQVIDAPVIIGPLIPSLLSRAVAVVGDKAPVFLTPDPVSSIGRAKAPSGAPLVYGSISQNDESQAIAAFVSVWEAKVRASRTGAAASAPVKLALMWEGDSGSTERVRAFENAVKLNGQPVLGKAEYRNIPTGNPAEKFNPASAAAKAILSVKEMQPDIIVALGALGISLVPIIEDEGVHPRWIGTYEMSSSTINARIMGNRDALASRLTYSYYVDPDLSLRGVWDVRFRYAYPDTPPFELAYSTFDTFYSLAFAMSRVQGPLTGASMSDAIQRSFALDGDIIEATPEAIRGGYDALANPAKKIQLSGILTKPYAYGPQGDLMRPRLNMVCLVPQGGSVVVKTGVEFDVATKSIIGDYNCP